MKCRLQRLLTMCPRVMQKILQRFLLFLWLLQMVALATRYLPLADSHLKRNPDISISGNIISQHSFHVTVYAVSVISSECLRQLRGLGELGPYTLGPHPEISAMPIEPCVCCVRCVRCFGWKPRFYAYSDLFARFIF